MGELISIEATGLTKHFGDVTAVNDLSLKIRSGEIYGFLGLNGAGKTTTIRMLLGMIKPSVGSASLFGTSHSTRYDLNLAAGRLHGRNASCLS